MSQEISSELESEGLSQSEDFSLDFSGVSSEESENGQNLPEDNLNQTQEQQTESQQTEELSNEDTLRNQLNDALAALNQYKQAELLNNPPQSQQANMQPQSQQVQSQSQQVQQQNLKPWPSQDLPKIDFLQGQDHIDILQDPGKFNELLCQVATLSFSAAVQAAQEEMMKKIPEIINTSTRQQVELENVTRDFYSKNQDLDKFRPAVSMAAMQLYNENPNLSLSEILSGAATRTREMLRLSQVNSKPVRQPAQPAGGSIRSAGGNRQTPTGQQLTDQEQQILDLLTI